MSRLRPSVSNELRLPKSWCYFPSSALLLTVVFQALVLCTALVDALPFLLHFFFLHRDSGS